MLTLAGCLVSTAWPADFVVQLTLPLVFALLVGFMPVLVAMSNGRKEKKDLRQKINQGISSSCLFLNITYLTVSRYSTSVFSCVTLVGQTRVLAVYPSMVCGSSQHTLYMVLGTLGIAVYMVGFPVGVATALSYMNQNRLHTNPNFIDALGWVYHQFEVKVFFYGLMDILRRTLFVATLHFDNPFWQSTLALFLVTAFGAFHLKLEPYKAYFLDELDFVLLSCLCVIAVSSLVFQLPSTIDKSFFTTWEAIVWVFAGLSLVAALVSMVKEARLKGSRLVAKRSLTKWSREGSRGSSGQSDWETNDADAQTAK